MKKHKPNKIVQKTPRVDLTLTRPGGLSYLEIPAVDVHKSSAFYKKMLSWNIRDEAPSKFSDQTGHLIGRFVTERAASHDPGLLPYFYIDRVRSAVKRATTNGGKIIKPPYPEGNLLIAVVRDP